MQILSIFAYIAIFSPLAELQVVALRVQTIDRKLRVMPVNQGVVETDFEPFGAKSVNPGTQKITTGRRIGSFVISKLRIPEAEAFVVLRSNDGITHTSFPGLTRPGDRVVKIRIEV